MPGLIPDIDLHAVPDPDRPPSYQGLKEFKNDYAKYSYINESWEEFEKRGKYGIFLSPYMNRATGDMVYFSRVMFDVLNSDAVNSVAIKQKIRQTMTPIIALYRYAVEEHNILDSFPKFEDVFKTYRTDGQREWSSNEL